MNLSVLLERVERMETYTDVKHYLTLDDKHRRRMLEASRPSSNVRAYQWSIDKAAREYGDDWRKSFYECEGPYERQLTHHDDGKKPHDYVECVCAIEAHHKKLTLAGHSANDGE